MSAHILTIEGRRRQSPIGFVQLEDFEYRVGPPVDPQIVLDNPCVSLYCLDHENQRAIFVETPPAVDLTVAPFFYQLQYQAAQRLIAVSYESLHSIARQIRVDPASLILIYSVGRCGSTLVSRAFSQVDGVRSISEPDVYTQLLGLRQPNGENTAEIEALLQSCTALFWFAAARESQAAACALKFRSFGIELADLFYRHYPEASVIFLYRDAESWARSVTRAFRVLEPETQPLLPVLQREFSKVDPLVAAYSASHTEPIAPLELVALLWISVMQRCLDLQNQGVPMFVARYAELKTDPRAVLEAMFRYCRLAARSGEALDRILAEDSQAGTSLSQQRARQAIDLSGEHLAHFRRYLQAYSTTLTPDFIVPHTLRPPTTSRLSRAVHKKED